MSSTEQAPEPTMDEILASIRKIISDDETEESSPPEAGAPAQESSPPPQTEAAAPELEAAAPAAEMPAPERAAPPAEMAAQDDAADAVDDILDLTQALEPQAESAPPQGDALQAALAETPAEPAPPEAFDDAGAESEAEIAALLAEAGVQDTAPDTAAAAPAPTAEETSITEALSAMDEAPAAPAPEPQMDASMPEDDFAADEASATAPEVEDDSVIVPPPPADMPAAEAADAGGSADVDDDFAAIAEEAPQPEVQEETVAEAPAPAVEEEPATAGFAGLDAGDAAQDEPGEEAQEQESLAADGGEGKTLEESVKDMLRPMLRRWLDDNMERIVHDAVKDEVASGDLPGKD